MISIEAIENSIGYCGLICRLCHLGDNCVGCKSSHNSCARHLSEKGCYQYSCCTEKNIAGCWECQDFPCGDDMFSENHDVRIRAFVRCAKNEGVHKLAEYIYNNQIKGIQYGHNKDYDNLGSEEKILQLLRTGNIQK